MPQFNCYCEHLVALSTQVHFAILMHPAETKKKIATGRMAHRFLKNSSLFVGTDFTHHGGVNQLLADPQFRPFLLYPTPTALTPAEVQTPRNQRPLVFLLDGTWHWARSIYRASLNLRRLPCLAFSPTRPSEFRVKRQPHPSCLSTLEAILHLSRSWGDEDLSPMHFAFEKMVERQASFSTGKATRGQRRSLLHSET